jgi:hypothetical protein
MQGYANATANEFRKQKISLLTKNSAKNLVN